MYVTLGPFRYPEGLRATSPLGKDKGQFPETLRSKRRDFQSRKVVLVTVVVREKDLVDDSPSQCS